ncbi:hypothetical protein JXC34_04015 [Candidatus Woesearchaeota archaeon]|nr:hypothetical protein [Candidatus Woesearchaeota archaeon]
MGFFDRIFKREPKEVTIKAIELDEWLEAESADTLASIDREITDYIANFSELKKGLKQKLQNLEVVELMNKEIPNRELHIMQGNRLNYVKKGLGFLEKIEFPEDHTDYEIIQSFAQEFENQLKEFNEVTTKGYYVLKNFFDKEMLQIASDIKNMENLAVKLITAATGRQVKSYNLLLSKIRELNESIVQSQKIENELNELQEEIESLASKQAELIEKKDQLKESHDYSSYQSYDKKKAEIDSKISDLNSRLNNEIKVMDRPLRKYMHDSLDKNLIESYLNNPLDALVDDDTYNILKVLSNLKTQLEKNKLDIKDKQKSKVLKQISSLDKAYLDSILASLSEFKKQKVEINRDMEKLTILMDYKELQYQLDHVSDKIKKHEESLKEKKEILSDIHVDSQLKKLEQSLSEFTGHDVTIEI